MDFPLGEPVQAPPGSARRNIARSRRWGDRRYKSCRRVTQNDQVPQSPSAIAVRGGGLIRATRSSGESTVERLSRACALEGVASPRKQLVSAINKNGPHCCKPFRTWVGTESSGRPGDSQSIDLRVFPAQPLTGSTVDWNGLAQRWSRYTVADGCERSHPPCSAMKPEWA